MASLISPTELKTHVQTTLSDAALQQIIDGEEADIIERFGPHVTQVEELEDELPGDEIFTTRKVSSVTEIVETVLTYDQFMAGFTQSETTLSSDDYEIIPGGAGVRRLDTGTNPLSHWGQRIKITYTPADASAKRVLALINLCKINLAFNGLLSESVGDGEYSYTQGDYESQRDSIFNSLRNSVRRYA